MGVATVLLDSSFSALPVVTAGWVAGAFVVVTTVVVSPPSSSSSSGVAVVAVWEVTLPLEVRDLV